MVAPLLVSTCGKEQMEDVGIAKMNGGGVVQRRHTQVVRAIDSGAFGQKELDSLRMVVDNCPA